jgi:hypothetical protein
MKRSVAMVMVLGVLFLASPVHAQGNGRGKPGGGGGGTTCPQNRLAFLPVTATELQTAIDCADPGATITLRAGSTQIYEGNFVLRHKPEVSEADGTTPKRITIQSSVVSNLAGNVRVTPAKQDSMAWLAVPAGSSSPVLATELKSLDRKTRRAASHYRFVGIKFTTDHWVAHLVRLGTGTEQLVDELPTGIAFDRSYFAGSEGEGSKQGLVANGRDIAVTNSYFKDFKDTANDALAIAIWNGPGPYMIQNNYLEGSGENMMSGGGDPTIPDLVPSDMIVRWNHFFKPPHWTFETSTQAGTPFGKKWRIKNLFELKNARRVTVRGNVFENNWIQADQHGFAIQLTPRNQGGGCRWCTVEDVTFEDNIVRNSTAGINVMATDDTRPSGPLQRVAIRNNLLVNITGNAFPGTPILDRSGRLVQILNPSTTVRRIDLTVDRNTAFSSREVSFSGWNPTSGVAFTNNVIRHNRCTAGNDCGMSGNNTSPGMPSITAWFTSPVVVSGNILFDAGRDRSAEYPAGNQFPDTVSFASSIDQVTGVPSGPNPDYTAVDSTTGAPLGVGVDWPKLEAQTDVATSGVAPAEP